jgi:cold shock protein
MGTGALHSTRRGVTEDDMRGQVTRLTAKGYGFIQTDDGGPDVFFHAAQVMGKTFEQLRVGDAVAFDVLAASVRGPRAECVRVLED